MLAVTLAQNINFLRPHQQRYYDLDLLPEELQHLFDQLEKDEDIVELLKHPKYKAINSYFVIKGLKVFLNCKDHFNILQYFLQLFLCSLSLVLGLKYSDLLTQSLWTKF